MKVLLTGAAGHLGTETVRALRAAGLEVRATDRSTRPDVPARIEVADLLDREGCYRLVEGVDAVIHLANYPHPSAADPQRLMTQNTAMNVNVFQAAVDLGVKKILFASSIQVVNGDRKWGEGQAMPPSMLPYLPLDGDTPANPANAYSLSKRAGELMLESMAKFHGVWGVALRFPALIKRGAPGWQRRRQEQKGRPAWGLLDEAFAYLFSDEAAALLAAIVRADLPGFRIYLPAARVPSLDEPVSRIVATYYAGVPLRRPATEMTGLVDTSRIERETGWGPGEEDRGQ